MNQFRIGMHDHIYPRFSAALNRFIDLAANGAGPSSRKPFQQFVTRNIDLDRLDLIPLLLGQVLRAVLPERPFADNRQGYSRPYNLSRDVRSSTILYVTSSEISLPDAMMACTSRASGVSSVFISRNISPVEICGIPRRSCKSRACVPFPAPGAPINTMILSHQNIYSHRGHRVTQRTQFLYLCVSVSLWLVIT